MTALLRPVAASWCTAIALVGPAIAAAGSAATPRLKPLESCLTAKRARITAYPAAQLRPQYLGRFGVLVDGGFDFAFTFAAGAAATDNGEAVLTHSDADATKLLRAARRIVAKMPEGKAYARGRLIVFWNGHHGVNERLFDTCVANASK